MGNSRNLREARALSARVHRSASLASVAWLRKESKQRFVHEVGVKDRQTVGRTKKLSTYFAAVRETNNKRHGRSRGRTDGEQG
ncbi:hypothetical protein WN48_09868 [Eufriesea mexicana]|nr:hypothetical protein WN48_09868 [Eufriesea mexicana]